MTSTKVARIVGILSIFIGFFLVFIGYMIREPWVKHTMNPVAQIYTSALFAVYGIVVISKLKYENNTERKTMGALLGLYLFYGAIAFMFIALPRWGVVLFLFALLISIPLACGSGYYFYLVKREEDHRRTLRRQMRNNQR